MTLTTCPTQPSPLQKQIWLSSNLSVKATLPRTSNNSWPGTSFLIKKCSRSLDLIILQNAPMIQTAAPRQILMFNTSLPLLSYHSLHLVLLSPHLSSGCSSHLLVNSCWGFRRYLPWIRSGNRRWSWSSSDLFHFLWWTWAPPVSHCHEEIQYRALQDGIERNDCFRCLRWWWRRWIRGQRKSKR